MADTSSEAAFPADASAQTVATAIPYPATVLATQACQAATHAAVTAAAAVDYTAATATQSSSSSSPAAEAAAAAWCF